MKRGATPERPTKVQDASPQTKNGHTRIANELLEEVYRFPFTAPQLRVLMFVIRDSYGWQEKETRAYSMSKIAEATNLPRSSTGRAVMQLINLSVLNRLTGGALAPIKNYNAWGKNPELPLEHTVPLVRRPTGETKTVPLARRKLSTGETKPSRQWDAYKEKERKERKKGGASAQTPQLLPNSKTDTPRNRAEIGHEDYAPEDHHEFKRLSFKLQDELTETWKAAREKTRKATECRKGCGRPRATETWNYCRPCTTCVVCSSGVGEGRTFSTKGKEIYCNECKTKT